MSDRPGERQSRRRRTAQQRAVAQEVGRVDEFRSAQDIHAAMRSSGSTVGLATVYRALQTFADDGEVDLMRTGDGEAVYRSCSRGHHHHLVCRECGRAVEIQAPQIESWASEVGTQHGFTGISHLVELFGTCADCAS